MSATSSPMTPLSVALIVAGSLLLVVATALATVRREAGRSFSWLFVAATAYSLLGLAAASHSAEAAGVQAAVVQLLAVLLAAAVGVLCPAGGRGETGGQCTLPKLAYGLAWLTLAGIAPTAGFHGKILIYRSLLAAGWEWLAVLAMAGSAASLLPALRGLGAPPTRSLRGSRAVLVVGLIAAIVFLGVYPQAGLAVAAWAAEPAAAA